LPDPKEIEGASHDDTATVELIAAAIHETWRALAAAEGWRMSPRFDQDYALLEEADREDNRAAARRMPEVLALAGLTSALCQGFQRMRWRRSSRATSSDWPRLSMMAG